MSDTTNTQNEALILKGIIKEIDKSPNHIHDICEICIAHNIKRRGLYDFLSISSAFEICKKITSDKFEWRGFRDFENMMHTISQNVECESKVRSIKEIFDCSTNSSLQNMALALLKLFLYLDVKFLDLRQAGKLFSGGIAKYKTMLRKLYTISSCMEIAGIISKTNAAAEIKLNYTGNLTKNSGSMDVLSLLNTEQELQIQNEYQRRRKDFEMITNNGVAIQIKTEDQKKDDYNSIIDIGAPGPYTVSIK